MINANDIISSAKNLIGKVDYVFGANNIPGGKGDCSSFTQYLFKQQGVNIGRDTQAQWTGQGVKVERTDLKKGDLVFFKNTYNNNHTDGVSHVGVYIGNNEFIHLSSSKDVTISNLNSDYYNNHYLGAKRISEVYSTNENVIENNIVQLGVKDWWTDQKENIVRYIFIILMVLLAVIFLGLSIYNIE